MKLFTFFDIFILIIDSSLFMNAILKIDWSLFKKIIRLMAQFISP